MASNDETLFAIPQISCPSCQCVMDLSRNQFQKLSKEQRKALHNQNTYATTSRNYDNSRPDSDMEPDDAPEHTFVVVSCSNHYCKQYNRFKVCKLPKIAAPSIKVSLE